MKIIKFSKFFLIKKKEINIVQVTEIGYAGNVRVTSVAHTTLQMNSAVVEYAIEVAFTNAKTYENITSLEIDANL